MLFNPSHPTNGSRVAPSLLDIYVRYKQFTRAIVAWLVSHSTRKYQCARTVSIRDLLDLAEAVQRKGVAMPDTIDFQFREAIAARTQLSKFFRREGNPGVDDQETLNHEYFTTSLTKIYTGLCECCASPIKSCERPNLGRSFEKNPAELPNRYAVLGLNASDIDLLLTDKQPNQQCDECARDNRAARAKPKATPRIVDDHLGDAFDLCRAIQEISNLRLATIKVWEQAAQAGTPFVVAAFITNAAYAAFEEVEQRLNVLCDGSAPDVLRRKFMQMQEDMQEDLGTSQDIKHGVNSVNSQQIEALHQAWELLMQFKRRRQEQKCERRICIIPRPSRVVLRKGSDSALMDNECLTVMLQNIEQHVQASRRPTCIVRLGTPVYAEIGYFLTHVESDTNGLRCSFGLQLLLETYKSYLLASQCQCEPSSCRLQALKFAQEAIPYLRAVLDDSSMPCRCCHTLATHLENVQLDFKAFLQQNVFDLYFQSPWVSGSHILEMLELLFYYGLRLFSYRHYVGSILHVYNILGECTGFQSIPLLDQLCDTFSDILFPGGRPKRSFKACCFRYMGGRLRFNPHASGHRSGSHQMCIPARTAKATAGFGLQKEANDARFEYRKISLLHHVKERGYHLEPALWKRVDNLANPPTPEEQTSSRKGPKRRSCSHPPHAHAPSTSSTTPPPHQLHTLHTALQTEFTGPFPTARINFFAIYLSCIRIVSLISDRVHQQGQAEGISPTTAPLITNCLCFLDAMLDAADRYRDNEYRMQPFGCGRLVEICGGAIREVLGEVGLEGFLWEGV